MSRFDRLSALFSHFTLNATVAEAGTGNLAVLAGEEPGEEKALPKRIVFRPRGPSPRQDVDRETDEAILLDVRVDFGGAANPLLAGLPEVLSLPAACDEETELLLRLLLAEAKAARCGFASVLSRLAEVLIIRVLRHEIEHGTTEAGLFAGLADPRLSKGIVAMHEAPERDWRNHELAAIAGLSPSRFAELFRKKLNATPQAYLRRWRMTLARQDIARGDRIKAISRRYGYGSSEAFAKAFHRHFGSNPLALRQGRSRQSEP